MVNVGRTSTFDFMESELLVIYCSVFFFLLLLCCFSIKVKEVPSTLMKDSESLVVLWFSVPLRSGLFVVSNGENPTNTNVRSVPPP